MTVRCSPDAFYSDISGEIVLLNAATGRYHSLDAIGGEIWHALDAAPTVDALCETMIQGYPANPDEVRADTLEFIGKLADRSLVIVE